MQSSEKSKCISTPGGAAPACLVFGLLGALDSYQELLQGLRVTQAFSKIFWVNNRIRSFTFTPWGADSAGWNSFTKPSVLTKSTVKKHGVKDKSAENCFKSVPFFGQFLLNLFTEFRFYF